MREKPDLPQVLTIYRRYIEARNELLESLRLGRFSNRDPLAEFSEWLVAALVGGALAESPVQKDWDVQTEEGKNIQVKYLANSNSDDEKNAKWVNEHEIRVNTGMDRYALVIFENLLPKTVIIFPSGNLEDVGKALGKQHGNLSTTLQFTRVNYLNILEHKDDFKSIGVQIYPIEELLSKDSNL